MKRICCICKNEKKIEEFCKDKHDKSGYTYSCKTCRAKKHKEWSFSNPEKVKALNEKHRQTRRDYYNSPKIKEKYNLLRIKRDFGMEAEDYLNLQAKQKGLCAICGEPETCSRQKNLSLDHNHETGKVRELLCNSCNRGLGYFRDKHELLQKATNYLIKHEKQ